MGETVRYPELTLKYIWMTAINVHQREQLLSWFDAALGPCEILADHSRAHPGQRSAAFKLRTARGECFVKIHLEQPAWEQEVYSYEHWASAFSVHAPRLLAVRDEPPLALAISALPGRILEESHLSEVQQTEVWRAAGAALRPLHALGSNDWFGPCRRDGSCAGAPSFEAVAYVTGQFDDLERRGRQGGFLSSQEWAIVQAARGLIPAYAGERPVPCHRDYCPANWMVSPGGEWTGVIDFEFAYWDVRAADFTRNPAWDWLHHPNRLAAMLAGYGEPLTPRFEQQLLAAHALYALVAIVWGEENDYHGFAGDGRQALQQVGQLLS
jgi:aminoglycoside phosphotransferase